jgi:DNA-binding winged helix-turn-helix (wHTH) protein
VDPNQPIEFGPFRLDPASGLLLKDGVPVPLTPKAFGVLHYLAARADRLVSKQELLEAMWPKVFVGDAV